MRQIDTTVVTNSAGYPGLANNPSVEVGIDFLQHAMREVSTGLALALTQNANNPTILAGLQVTGSTITAGWVFYAGEIYYIPAQTIAGSVNAYIGASWVANPTDTGANKTILSDGSAVSMHNQRTVNLTYSAIANSGNLPDFGQWEPTAVQLTGWVGIAATPGYQNGFVDKGAPFNNGRYRRIGPNTQLSGVIVGTANTTTIAFQLPQAYTPAATSNFYVWSNGTSAPATVSIAVNGVCTVTLPLGQNECSLEGIIFPVY